MLALVMRVTIKTTHAQVLLCHRNGRTREHRGCSQIALLSLFTVCVTQLTGTVSVPGVCPLTDVSEQTLKEPVAVLFSTLQLLRSSWKQDLLTSLPIRDR